MPYNKRFYDGQSYGSQRSAAVVVPLLMEIINVRSVVDVGCGVGTWLHVFSQHGISDYLGIDGSYVERDSLKIPQGKFKAMDLRNEMDLERSFDLACSLEVAEHLPPSAAASFVSALVRAAPLVLFSAAVPGQGGMDHVNEQWQSYWAHHFAQHGYEAVDCVRPKIFGNVDVEWWYQQNTILYCAPGRRPPGFEIASPYDLDRAHSELIEGLRARPRSGKEALVAITRSVKVLASKSKERLFIS